MNSIIRRSYLSKNDEYSESCEDGMPDNMLATLKPRRVQIREEDIIASGEMVVAKSSMLPDISSKPSGRQFMSPRESSIQPKSITSQSINNSYDRSTSPLVSKFIGTNPKYMKMIEKKDEPIPISGARLLPADRKVIWKNVCLLGEMSRECIVEMSYVKNKFYIISLDLEFGKYSSIELFRPQAQKLIKACANMNQDISEVDQTTALHRLMTFLEFRFGQLCIKDQELLMQYQLYMSPEMIKQSSQKEKSILTSTESNFVNSPKKKSTSPH